MTEYTPTTEAVRDVYVEAQFDVAMPDALSEAAHAERFDRWLAAHDLEVAATVLESAANLMRGNGTKTDYWDGQRVEWVLFEQSPRRGHPRDVLLDRARAIREGRTDA